MKVVLFGASGMVGQGVLRECLLDPGVDSVLVVGRRPIGTTAEKLREIVRPDLTDLGDVAERFREYDAAFCCLGISSLGRTEAEFRGVTFDLTLAVAGTLARVAPGMAFVYVSGAGTDSSERGRAMWARVKGATENALLRLPFRAAYMFRPGIIRPLHGIRSRTRSYRILYRILSPVLFVVRAVAPDALTSTEAVGRAMIRVARDGAPHPILGTREINRLGASPPRTPA